MSSYMIFTDSGCDIPEHELAENGIKSVQMTFTLSDDEKVYKSPLSVSKFYSAMRSGSSFKTSAANSEDFYSAFYEVLRGGHDILYLGFSSALSGTYRFSHVAALELKEQFPERRIILADTLCGSAGEGLLLHLALEKQKEGASLDELAQYVEHVKGKICHWFTVDDLAYLKRGGRIGSASMFVGHIFNIKPILHMDEWGCLIPVSKVRGRKNAVKDLANRYGELACSESNTVFIGHGDCCEDAYRLSDAVREKNPAADVHIYPIGPVIGAHSGPGTLAVFFLGERR